MTKILVDSASDVELNEANEMNVSLIPMQIRFGEEEFEDGINLDHRTFFEKLIESAELPQTSQINEFRFAERFEELTADGSEVVAIVLSSKLSGTFREAEKAAKKFKGKVFVVDSLNACVGERLLLLYALRLRDAGMGAAEITSELEKKRHDVQLLAVLDTLKYLRKGGRISSVKAMAGELLSIKPVISVVDGEIKMVGKAIGSKKSNNLLMQLVDSCGGIDFTMPYALAYSGLSDEFLKKYLHDSERLWKNETDEVPSYLIGSTIGTHVGPGAIAVSFFSKS